MYNRLDTIPACDRQTDEQTSCHGIVRAIHTRRAVKTEENRKVMCVMRQTQIILLHLCRIIKKIDFVLQISVGGFA